MSVKKEVYYEIRSDHPASWLVGKLVVNRKQLDEIVQKAREKGVAVRYRPKQKTSVGTSNHSSTRSRRPIY